MNIFFVHFDAYQAAQELCDKHVVKMIVETAQLLSTAHRLLDGKEAIEVRETPWCNVFEEWSEEHDCYMPVTKIMGYKKRNVKVWRLDDDRDALLYGASHRNHPSAIWCRTSVQNYLWLVDHLDGLLQEYTYRYGKVHKTFSLLYTLQTPPMNLKDWDMTPAPSCMPDDCKIGSLTDNYRAYYNKYKSHIHTWKNRPTPTWIAPPS